MRISTHISDGGSGALVPLKIPEFAKSRLSPVLSASQRQAVFFVLARRVIGTLSSTRGIDRVVVVTASDEVSLLARELGADVIRQSGDRGTAEAFRSGIEFLGSFKFRRILMIAGDLPLISTESVGEILQCASKGPNIVVVPDRRRIGTNALLVDPPNMIAPCFGFNSFARHLALAERSGIPARVVESAALALDLDEPEDLNCLLSRPEGASLLPFVSASGFSDDRAFVSA